MSWREDIEREESEAIRSAGVPTDLSRREFRKWQASMPPGGVAFITEAVRSMSYEEKRRKAEG